MSSLQFLAVNYSLNANAESCEVYVMICDIPIVYKQGLPYYDYMSMVHIS